MNNLDKFINRSMNKNEKSEGGNPPTENKQVKREKTCFMRIIFWCTVLAIGVYAVVTIIFLYEDDETANGIATTVTALFTIFAFTICTCQNAQSFRQALYLYFLLDNTLIILIFTLIAWNFYIIVIINQDMTSLDIAALFFISLSFFMFVGNFRVLIKRYQWSKCDVIVTKLSFIVGTIVYIVIACHFMVTQGKLYPDISSDNASILKDFSIFYAIALFTLYYDMYSKISTKDGTDEQKFHYKMKEPEQFILLDENMVTK